MNEKKIMFLLLKTTTKKVYLPDKIYVYNNEHCLNVDLHADV